MSAMAIFRQSSQPRFLWLGCDRRNCRLLTDAVSNGYMRIFAWRWSLPVLQIALAASALVYAPYQYRARPHPIGDDFMLLGFRQTWPPPVLRVSYAVNFPAFTAAYSVQFASWAPRDVIRYQGRPFVSISVQDCIFLVSVGVLWYWIGRILDRRKRAPQTAPIPKSLGVVRPSIGLLFSVGVSALASFCAMLTDADRPLRQIGFLGLLWAGTLLWHFGSNLIASLRTR